MASELKVPRPTASTTSSAKKPLFLKMLFIPLLKFSLGISAEGLGGVGGFSRKKMKRGTHKTVEMIASINKSCTKRLFPSVEEVSSPTIAPGSKNPTATPKGAARVNSVVNIVLYEEG